MTLYERYHGFTELTAFRIFAALRVLPGSGSETIISTVKPYLAYQPRRCIPAPQIRECRPIFFNNAPCDLRRASPSRSRLHLPEQQAAKTSPSVVLIGPEVANIHLSFIGKPDRGCLTDFYAAVIKRQNHK